MAVKTRTGPYNKFDPRKLIAGEWGTVTEGDPNAADGRAVYMCFGPGDVKRMATYEDMTENVDRAAGDVIDQHIEEKVGTVLVQCQKAYQSMVSATNKATEAVKAANEAVASATAAAKAAQEAAEKCAGLTDNSRVSALETQMSEVITALGKVLAIEE